MVKCSFCGDQILLGRGKIFVKSDGRIFSFHNSKCEKNFRLGRAGKKTCWTSIHRKAKAKK
ncbi:MAG: 50S ribosomal protein L24e [Candidatus Aenigmarchaeota archaeon]|nr:50S ribosomal protein L24e [Candidatus Aenigmarchaeota archaeon]